jgi:AcrR family transcriptional regulator
MAKKKSDRRARKTRAALTSAFVELVLSRGYEAVTIGEISDKANVGRSTFYSHYTSKKDLLEESLQRPSSGLAACVGGDATPQGLIPLLDHFSEQRAVNRIFFEPPVRTVWVRALAALIEPRLPRAARGSGMRPMIPPALIALLVAEMQIALITHWLTGRFALTAEVVAANLIANSHALLVTQFPAVARTSMALSVG